MKARVQFINRDEGCFHVGGNPGLEYSALYKRWELSTEAALQLYEELYLHECYIDIVMDDTVGGVIAKCEQAMGVPLSAPKTRGHSLALGIQDDLLRFFDDDINVATIMKYYPDGQISDAYIVITNVAGELKIGSGKLRYFIRSHEAGKHHEPHVHVTDSSRENSAAILLLNGEVLANSGLSSKQIKLAKKEIAENRDELIRHWNMNTDGIRIELDEQRNPVQIVDAGRMDGSIPPYLY